ncbi:hypothetical protein NC653_030644 [Populus alba x Populus x berolinensis]|uniref:Amine oxidase domain-containing protein n=1 Tax=Populus alba x Populus x berolinensis TaxID=444605 RepID=A0AAD6LWT2_9ROSI|nr:hypothetical protein NC653_030644 [Populus alba x Populus x berolinensis]
MKISTLLSIEDPDNYLKAGVFTSAIYDEDCIFEDPTIKFQGTKLYSRNLKLLVPFTKFPFLSFQLDYKTLRRLFQSILTYLTVLALFPSSQGLEVTWSSVVKIAQSLYREGPGKDLFRPDQRTPVKNFFLAGSYTKQDYIDSMEGATLSGRQASAYVCGAGEELVALRKTLAAVESQDGTKSHNLIDELSLV